MATQPKIQPFARPGRRKPTPVRTTFNVGEACRTVDGRVVEIVDAYGLTTYADKRGDRVHPADGRRYAMQYGYGVRFPGDSESGFCEAGFLRGMDGSVRHLQLVLSR